jgi:nucleoside-diphosphate-sugar epimerase
MSDVNPSRCLIGHSGYVGSTLSRQARFDSAFRRADIGDIRDRAFDLVVCAGVPAQKWIANRDPVADRENIESLIAHLDTVTCGTFVLISTVDVFKSPVGVDEDTPVDEHGLPAYGLHRRGLEKFVERRFANRLIVRLPGLVGPGLRKNVVFDLLNENALDAVDRRAVFQFYPMVNLWYDIRTALKASLKLVHLTAEPVSVADVARLGFDRSFERTLASAPATYDMRTRHAEAFGETGDYQYRRRASIQAIRAYAQSEPRVPKPAEGAAR